MMNSPESYESYNSKYINVLKQIFSGEFQPFKDYTDPDFLTYFLEKSREDSLHPLLFHRMNNVLPFDCPEKVRTKLKRASRAEAARDCLREAELKEVLNTLAVSKIDVLVLKGAALAYSLYQESYLRPRMDTDLWIHREAVGQVKAVMMGIGYDLANVISGEFVSYQFVMRKKNAGGFAHALDFHTKICNPQKFSGLFDFNTSWDAALSVNTGNFKFKTLNEKQALIYACVHRIAHHHGNGPLIWLHDIHLLASGRDADWFEQLLTLTGSLEVKNICVGGILFEQSFFGTVFPERTQETFELVAEQGGIDMETKSLRPKAPPLASLILDDLRELPRWRDKFVLLREHFFPSTAYMLKKYSATHRLWLPFFYVRRIFGGALKLLNIFK